MIRGLLLAFALTAAMAPATAQAVRPDEMLPDPGLEARAREVGGELRCLVCRNRVDLARAAAEMKTPEERRRLDRGRSRTLPTAGRGERAARAGLAIIDAIARLNDEAFPKLAARVGIDDEVRDSGVAVTQDRRGDRVRLTLERSVVRSV